MVSIRIACTPDKEDDNRSSAAFRHFCYELAMFRTSALLLLTHLCLATFSFAQEIDFADDVVPILKKHCAECHTGEKSEGGFSFNTQRLLLESGYTNTEADGESRLIQLIRSSDPEDQMPPKDKPRLSAEEVTVLTRWISAGITWEPGFRFASTGYEPPLLPRDVILPAAEFDEQNPIDRILNAYYREHQVTLPKKVDDATFLRRAYLDLIGLPPNREEQTAFDSYTDAGKRAQLVDQLLSDERKHDFAEHWMTFWNDLLRNDYAGTGFIDGGRKQITSWLYESLLTNKPYDQFVRELISPTPESEGFINGIQWRGSVNASQVREIQFAQNVSQVFLGINMKCASCHDSFIDRWTLDEAYGLAAIYSTRELEIHRCDKPVGRTAKARWIFPEVGDVDPAAEQPERLKQLAAVMTSPRNGRFSRTIVNRLWHRLMGHGIVHPVDAMHTEPWNADLLDYLANYLVETNYDVKAVLRLIATSDAYQSHSAAAQDSATATEFVFQGPTARHLTAEQFIDSVWMLTINAPLAIQAPIPSHIYYGEKYETASRSGKWIWAYENITAAPAGERVAFKKQFEVSADLSRAILVITCDNDYTAYVNGKKVKADANWETIESLDVSKHLKAGTNVIFVDGGNGGAGPNPAGLYAELVMTDQDGNMIRIATDDSWQISTQIPKPGKLESVEWSNAIPVSPQTFLGPTAESRIVAELTSATNTAVRSARAALLKSNLLMRSLGRPNREQIVTTRPDSLSTLQAIDLANGEILDNMLAAGATKRLPEADVPKQFIENLFRDAVCREPSGEERRLAESVLGEQPTVESVQDLLWLLVMLPEFQFVQ